jgi:hypothetical protein
MYQSASLIGLHTSYLYVTYNPVKMSLQLLTSFFSGLGNENEKIRQMEYYLSTLFLFYTCRHFIYLYLNLYILINL